MSVTVLKSNQLRGEINIPGDKSISHRAVIFNSMASSKKISIILAIPVIPYATSCITELLREFWKKHPLFIRVPK